eukprot:640956-Pyramimonas_sp.AAC.1
MPSDPGSNLPKPAGLRMLSPRSRAWSTRLRRLGYTPTLHMHTTYVLIFVVLVLLAITTALGWAAEITDVDDRFNEPPASLSRYLRRTQNHTRRGLRLGNRTGSREARLQTLQETITKLARRHIDVTNIDGDMFASKLAKVSAAVE